MSVPVVFVVQDEVQQCDDVTRYNARHVKRDLTRFQVVRLPS